MPNMESIDYSNLFCLFKGEPGTRKSTAALSFPKPIYYFDFDQKMDALTIPMRLWNINPKDIDYDSYNNWDACKFKLEGLMLPGCRYKTIVIDSITSLADAINRQTLKDKAGEGSGKRVGKIPVNSIEDFNAEDSALKEMIALCKIIKSSNKVNIILVGHIIQKDVKTPDGQTHVSRMLVTAGKGIAQKIPAYCSEVYHFNIVTGFDKSKGGQYGLYTIHTGDDFARTSLPLDEHITFGNDNLYEKWIKPAITKLTQGQTNATSSIL